MDLLKVTMITKVTKDFTIKDTSIWQKKMKGFSLGVFNRLCETHSKCYNNGNLESMSELIVFIKVTPKATVVN